MSLEKQLELALHQCSKAAACTAQVNGHSRAKRVAQNVDDCALVVLWQIQERRRGRELTESNLGRADCCIIGDAWSHKRYTYPVVGSYAGHPTHIRNTGASRPKCPATEVMADRSTIAISYYRLE